VPNIAGDDSHPVLQRRCGDQQIGTGMADAGAQPAPSPRDLGVDCENLVAVALDRMVEPAGGISAKTGCLARSRITPRSISPIVMLERNRSSALLRRSHRTSPACRSRLRSSERTTVSSKYIRS
jgi:hypothetical protein